MARVEGFQAIERGLALLAAVARDGGVSSLSEIAGGLGLPRSTAHRLASGLASSGHLARIGRGRYLPGFALMRVAAAVQPGALLVAVARPLLRELARRTGRVAHLGQFEQGMVTYLIREAPPRGSLFTREAMQLEAYCSAIGKMLLTMQAEVVREAYLADGTFVPLTEHTIVDPAALRRHLDEVSRAGVARDEEEVERGLFCMAVAVETPAPCAPTALSLAGGVPSDEERAAIHGELIATATLLQARLGA